MMLPPVGHSPWCRLDELVKSIQFIYRFKNNMQLNAITDKISGLRIGSEPAF